MIYITGDTHGSIDIGKLSSRNFPIGRSLTKDDYLIICGDFGLVWDGDAEERYLRGWLASKPWTTLFVDGNHENFDMLIEFPERDMFWDKVGVICDGVYHLKRGRVYTINGKKFFTIGGATSHDQGFRREFISWWRQEMPNIKEYNTAIGSLNNVDWNVDYVITHSAPTSVMKMLCSDYATDRLTNFLQEVSEKLSFTRWYFGHYHVDIEVSKKYHALYNAIERVM